MQNNNKDNLKRKKLYIYMLIRNINGELIFINRYDCPSDAVYYEKIMNIKKEFTKSNENNVNNSNVYKKYSKSKDIISEFINIKIIS